MDHRHSVRHVWPLLGALAVSQLSVTLATRTVDLLSDHASAMVLHIAALALVLGSWLFLRIMHDVAPSADTRPPLWNRAIALAPVSILGLGIGLTTMAVVRIRAHTEQMARIRFDQLTDRVATETDRRVNQVVYGLHGARGMFHASDAIGRREFIQYVRSRDLAAEFPGAIGMGFIKRVRRDDLASFLEQERADAAPGFEVQTSGSARDMYVVTAIEPDSASNASWGFDAGSEPVRRAAIESAVRSGRATLSGRVTLFQDQTHRAGFLYLVPVYRNGTDPVTPEEREAALVGIVYAPLVIDEVLSPIVRAGDSMLGISVTDVNESGADVMLYECNASREMTGRIKGSARASKLSDERALHVGGRTWLLSMRPLPRFYEDVERSHGAAVGIGGVTLSLLAAACVWALASGRSRARTMAEKMTRDLAAAKARAEDALRRFEALRQTLNQHSIISVADGSGRIIDMNEAFCRISGYSREELLGKDHRIINSGEHPKSFWVEMWRTVAAGNPWRADVCNRAKDGSLYWVDSIIAPFRGPDGRIEQIVSIRSDITPRKHSEAELVEKNLEMEQFVYTASHDLKSPIVTIQGYVRHLLQDLEAGKHEELADYAGRIRRAAERMRGSIDDLLDLSRVGRATLTPEEIDVRAFVEELREGFSARLEESGVAFETSVNVRTFCFDRGQLTHLLQNLVENAIHYGCDGAEKRVEVIVEPSPDGGIDLRVRDHGAGIPPQHRERVFGLFQRLSSSKSGTGVGLAIVRGIVQRNKGSVTIEDTPGGGTTMRVRLVPLASTATAPEASGASSDVDEQCEVHSLSAG